MALLQAQHLVILGITAVVFHLLTTAQRSGLRQIPGPFLAKVTDLWRLFDHWRGTHVETQRSLHEKYGPAVRIGPNAVSLSDPALLKTVYSTRGEFAKVSSKKPRKRNGHGICDIQRTHADDCARPFRVTITASPMVQLMAKGCPPSSPRGAMLSTLKRRHPLPSSTRCPACCEWSIWQTGR
jgi:hypothetical protein